MCEKKKTLKERKKLKSKFFFCRRRNDSCMALREGISDAWPFNGLRDQKEKLSFGKDGWTLVNQTAATATCHQLI